MADRTVVIPQNPYSAPRSNVVPVSVEDPLTLEARALRLAGAFLVLGAVLNVASMVLTGSAAVRTDGHAPAELRRQRPVVTKVESGRESVGDLFGRARRRQSRAR